MACLLLPFEVLSEPGDISASLKKLFTTSTADPRSSRHARSGAVVSACSSWIKPADSLPIVSCNPLVVCCISMALTLALLLLPGLLLLLLQSLLLLFVQQQLLLVPIPVLVWCDVSTSVAWLC